jgi:hypothetical protein
MSESGMRQTLIQVLRVLDAIAVENPVYPGTPDINYIDGWIECKWTRHWPAKPNTPVRLDHELLPQQRVWLKRRRNRGGRAWVMLQHRQEWLLFDGAVAADHLGMSTRHKLIQLAVMYWPDGLNETELIKVLRG